jgi:type I restriction-modification system DNA methylase subunit
VNQFAKDFINILEHLKPSKHSYEVFSDWLIMAAASLYSWKRDQAAEDEYMQIAKQYKEAELEKHGQLLAITVEALERTEQDFLGSVFTEANLTNTRNGQFFTPYNVTLMMAKMIIGEKLPTGRVCRINDPCCGAGGMLIAGAMVMKERGFDFQNDALFIGQDIDVRCARMTFIQLTLLGVPAVVYCMNTLTMQEYWHRETIGYHMAGMDFRLRAEKMLGIIASEKSGCNKEAIISNSEAIDIQLPRRELVQGELF